MTTLANKLVTSSASLWFNWEQSGRTLDSAHLIYKSNTSLWCTLWFKQFLPSWRCRVNSTLNSFGQDFIFYFFQLCSSKTNPTLKEKNSGRVIVNLTASSQPELSFLSSVWKQPSVLITTYRTDKYWPIATSHQIHRLEADHSACPVGKPVYLWRQITNDRSPSENSNWM